jgi:hypothetical protein
VLYEDEICLGILRREGQLRKGERKRRRRRVQNIEYLHANILIAPLSFLTSTRRRKHQKDVSSSIAVSIHFFCYAIDSSISISSGIQHV